MPAISPRVSMILPTGDEDRGFGTGVVGYQFNLPISKTLSDRLYVNANVGVTVYPDADLRLSNGRHSGEFDLVTVNLGLSAFYAVTEDVNFLLEAVWESGQGLEERPSVGGQRMFARRTHTEEIVLAPGIRWAHNLQGGLQIVPGIAFPIGLSEDAMDYGVILYLSIEHAFMETEE